MANRMTEDSEMTPDPPISDMLIRRSDDLRAEGKDVDAALMFLAALTIEGLSSALADLIDLRSERETPGRQP
jgi:hypothetical protein